MDGLIFFGCVSSLLGHAMCPITGRGMRGLGLALVGWAGQEKAWHGMVYVAYSVAWLRIGL